MTVTPAARWAKPTDWGDGVDPRTRVLEETDRANLWRHIERPVSRLPSFLTSSIVANLAMTISPAINVKIERIEHDP